MAARKWARGCNTKIRQIAARCLGVRAGTDSRDADAHGQGAEHVRNGGLGGHRSERRGGDRCMPPDSRAACSRSRRNSRDASVREGGGSGIRQRIPLFAQGYYRTPEIHFDPKTATGKPFHYYAYGAAVSEVEIDGFTGENRTSARRYSRRRGRVRFATDRPGPD